MTIHGLLFDFDGLILETEGPVYQSWQELFQSMGANFPFSAWSHVIGTDEVSFDPLDLLEEQIGRRVDRSSIRLKRLQRELEMIEATTVLPGVMETLQEGRRLGKRMAVVSSSSTEWVAGHVERLGIAGYFDTLCTRDMVERAKPFPDLYLLALERLGLSPKEAVAFEDSSNGVAAAHAAGIFVVAVPTPITQGFDFKKANLILPSLAEMPLGDLLAKVETLKDGRKAKR